MAAELRILENQRLVQYITDNARWEATSISNGSVGGLSLNMSAGETILRYLRGCNLKAPVLVYCGGSIPFTTYVKEYSLAASTCEFDICRAFMAQLVSVQEAENEEEGFWFPWALGKGFRLRVERSKLWDCSNRVQLFVIYVWLDTVFCANSDDDIRLAIAWMCMVHHGLVNQKKIGCINQL